MQPEAGRDRPRHHHARGDGISRAGLGQVQKSARGGIHHTLPLPICGAVLQHPWVDVDRHIPVALRADARGGLLGIRRHQGGGAHCLPTDIVATAEALGIHLETPHPDDGLKLARLLGA